MPGPRIPDTDHVSRLCGASNRAEQLAAVRRHLTDKEINLPAKGRLAVLHLLTVFDHVRSRAPDWRNLTAHHEPEPPQDPSHAGIYGYSDADDLIADLIAEAVQEAHQARG